MNVQHTSWLIPQLEGTYEENNVIFCVKKVILSLAKKNNIIT